MRRSLVILLSVFLVTPACAAARERERQDFILESGNKAARLRTAAFTLSLRSRRKPTKEQPARPVVPPAPITFGGDVDFRRDRVTMGAQGQPGVAIFSKTTMYVVRHRRGLGSANPKPYAAFDFAETDQDVEEAVDVRGSVGFLWMNPAFMVRLVDGALNGSLRERGTADVGGVATRRWSANFDIEKATREDEEEEIQAVEHMFRTMGHGGPSFRGEVWIDANGVVRRFAMTLEQRIDSENTLLTTYTIELAKLGGAVQIDVPSREETVRVRNQVRLLLEVDIPAGGARQGTADGM